MTLKRAKNLTDLDYFCLKSLHQYLYFPQIHFELLDSLWQMSDSPSPLPLLYMFLLARTKAAATFVSNLILTRSIQFLYRISHITDP